MNKTNISKVCAVLITTISFSGCQMGPSDMELITNRMENWKTSLMEQQIDAIMQNYSEEYTSERGVGKERLGDFFESMIARGYLDDIEINLENAEVQIEGDAAVFDPVEITTVSGETMELKLTLGKEEDTWLIQQSSNR